MAFSEEILIRMGFDNSKVDRGLRSARQKADDSAKAIAASFKRYIGTIGAAFTIGGLVSAFNSIRQLADDISTRATNLGVGAEFLQKFAFAAEQTGIGAEKAQVGLDKLVQKIGLANTVGGEYAKMFETFGLNVQGKTMEQVLYDIADAMADMPDQFERNALAMKLFEEGGADLAVTLQGGSEALRELMKDGTALTDSQIRDIDRTDKAIKRFKHESTVAGGAAASNYLAGGDAIREGGILSQLASGMTGTLARFVVGGFFNKEFGGAEAINKGAELDRQRAAMNAAQSATSAKMAADEKKRQDGTKAFIEFQKAFLQYEEKQAKAVTAEYNKRIGLLGAFNAAVSNLTSSKAAGRNFTLQELLSLNPNQLDDFQYQQYLKAQDVAFLEEESKYASLTGNAGYARQLQDQALKIRSGITGITEADKQPYGEQEKRAADALDKMLDYVDSGGLPVNPVMGE